MKEVPLFQFIELLKGKPVETVFATDPKSLKIALRRLQKYATINTAYSITLYKDYDEWGKEGGIAATEAYLNRSNAAKNL